MLVENLNVCHSEYIGFQVIFLQNKSTNRRANSRLNGFVPITFIAQILEKNTHLIDLEQTVKISDNNKLFDFLMSNNQ